MNEKEIKEFYDDTTFPGLYSSEDIIDPGDYLIYLRYIDFIKDNNIKTILDVGCGTGFITNILAFHCPEVTITAIDFSNAIQHGIAISNELELGNIMWRQENFFDYRNIIKFDCVLSNGSIHHMPRFNDAVKKYRIKKSSFHYLPFGASIDFIPKQKLLKKIILKKNLNICKLISIGIHWDRKGMDKAVKLVDYMNNSGQETILYIVGAKPPKDYKISSNVKLIDFLDKNNLNDRKILIKLMYNAHFNLLFSKSEAFGVVNVEASAFGLYTITNNIGGIGGAVTNDINGFMFKDNENISTISKYIIRIFRNKDLFIKKSFLSRKQYQEKLNWQIISKNLSTIINNNLLKN
jgi:glycosyltransferase involved in cell wall biosynthesis